MNNKKLIDAYIDVNHLSASFKTLAPKNQELEKIQNLFDMYIAEEVFLVIKNDDGVHVLNVHDIDATVKAIYDDAEDEIIFQHLDNEAV